MSAKNQRVPVMRNPSSHLAEWYHLQYGDSALCIIVYGFRKILVQEKKNICDGIHTFNKSAMKLPHHYSPESKLHSLSDEHQCIW